MINELAKEIHQNARDKGFFEGEKNIGEMIALIHSEVSEALESDRKDRYSDLSKMALMNLMGQNDPTFQNVFNGSVKDTFEDELADVVIRVMDLAAFKGIDLEAHIRAKMRYNSLRPHKHGKRY